MLLILLFLAGCGSCKGNLDLVDYTPLSRSDWEVSTKELFELLYSGFRPSNLVDVPLVCEPGTEFEYSSLTSHLLGIIVARAAVSR